MQRQCRLLGKRKHRMKLILPPKLVEKLVWVPVISFCKIFIPSYVFDALLCRNQQVSPPNRLTLPITLLCWLFLICRSARHKYQVILAAHSYEITQFCQLFLNGLVMEVSGSRPVIGWILTINWHSTITVLIQKSDQPSQMCPKVMNFV